MRDKANYGRNPCCGRHPSWNTPRIVRDLRWLKQHHGWGFTVESLLDYTSLGLNHYLRGKLAWDVTRDTEPLLQDFCTHFFGPAAAPMRSYYQLIEKHLDSQPLHLESGMSDLDFRLALWNPTVVRKAERYLSETERLATRRPYRMRVAAFRAGFDNLQATRAAHAAASRGDFAEAARQTTRMEEIAQDLQQPLFLLDDGSGWLGAQSLHQFYTRLAEKTTSNGAEVLAVFPIQAHFRQDPVPHGLIFEWYRPDLGIGKPWQNIRLDQSWNVQGITGSREQPSYNGIGWYRVRIELPPEVSEQPVHLFFPSMKASAVWVWIDGKLAGYTTPAEDFDLDLSGPLSPGQHLIALRVAGHRGGRDIPFSGFGGIALPPLLYRTAR